MTTWIQKTITLAPKLRGFHVITPEVTAKLPELQKLRVGICHIFIQHTSASNSINERIEPEVRHDLETFFNRLVPEDADSYLGDAVFFTCPQTALSKSIVRSVSCGTELSETGCR